MSPCKLALIAPCYNEEQMLPHSAPVMLEKLQSLIEKGSISSDSFLLFVDDGSKDNTWSIITDLNNKDQKFRGIKLATNAGHQNALLAGMLSLKDSVDAIISLDVDLQDDINSIEEMVAQFHEGKDIVYGVRRSRENDSFFKRNSASLFYKLMRALGTPVKDSHSDYRLVSARVLKELSGFQEVNLFLRGIFPSMGFNHGLVYYERKAREHGDSKYSLSKMLYFAWEGITSFSETPLRLISVTGGIMFFLSTLYLLYVIYESLYGHTVRGWGSTIAVILFIGSIQLISVAIIGEYIGKIYKEIKKRPRYIIEEQI